MYLACRRVSGKGEEFGLTGVGVLACQARCRLRQNNPQKCADCFTALRCASPHTGNSGARWGRAVQGLSPPMSAVNQPTV